jgi:hypothetical protein
LFGWLASAATYGEPPCLALPCLALPQRSRSGSAPRSVSTQVPAGPVLPSLLHVSVRPVTCRRRLQCEVFLDSARQGCQRCPIAAHAARGSSLCYFVACHVHLLTVSLTTPPRPLNLLRISSCFRRGGTSPHLHAWRMTKEMTVVWPCTTASRRQLQDHCLLRVSHHRLGDERSIADFTIDCLSRLQVTS